MSPLSSPPEAEHRSRGGSRPMPLVLVAAIILVGAIPAVGGPPDPRVAAPVEPQPSKPIEDDEKASWCELAIFRPGPNRPRAILVVRRAQQSPVTTIDDPISREVLIREVVRQGFLLAARQGFDILVRDRAIGDPDEPGRSDATYRLGSIFQASEVGTENAPPGGRITIVEGVGAGRKVVWHRGLDWIGSDSTNHDLLVRQVEVMARTDFRDVLAGWKLAPASVPRASKKTRALPTGVDKRLLSLAETEQFAALRALHEAVRRDGGSPERWLALSRGYAMLGSLTEPLLGVSHEVFKARSLLYAQEAVVSENESPRSLREQAFAEAMVGLFPLAQDHLDRADGTDPSQAQAFRTRMIRAYLATDPDALGRLVAESPNDLAPLYLQAIVRSRLSGPLGTIDRTCRNEIIANLDEVLARVPDCHRAIDAMCGASGVANAHRATTIDLESFASTSAARVSAVPGLPPSVARTLSQAADGDEVGLRRSLVQASRSDTNDLTWGVLAEQLREIRFLQVCRRLSFLTYFLASGASEFVEVARPMVADHPNHDYIELFPGEIDRKRAIEILDQLDFADLELKNLGLMEPVRRIDKERRSQLYYRSTQDGWATVQNCERHLRWAGTHEFQTKFINSLFGLDPYSPVARSTLVEVEWIAGAPQVADWEREQPWNTLIFASEGFQLLKEKRFAEAQERFQTTLKRSPEYWIFAGLAQSYREQGQVDPWVKAAEAMLEQPDQALDHANIANELAQYLMDQGQVDRAWPWAERGAQSWAGWAMNTAWKCAEMRRDWANAELWVARLAERYDGDWLDWLTWCERTGQGDIKAASEMVWARWDATKSAGTDGQALLLAHFGLILGRPDITRQIAESRVEADPKSSTDLILEALACDRQGDLKARDEAFDSIVNQPDLSGPKTTKIVSTLIEWYRHRDTAKLDLAPIDAMLLDVAPQNRPRSQIIVGLFLSMFGRADAAVPYLKAAEVEENLIGYRLIARHLLKARGEPVSDFLFNAPAAKPEPGAGGQPVPKATPKP